MPVSESGGIMITESVTLRRLLHAAFQLVTLELLLQVGSSLSWFTQAGGQSHRPRSRFRVRWSES